MGETRAKEVKVKRTSRRKWVGEGKEGEGK